MQAIKIADVAELAALSTTAAGGGNRECDKGAAVKIRRSFNAEQRILGTARVTRTLANSRKYKLICGCGGIGRRARFRF